ncbi:MAG: hypothetical protein JW894_07710 [Bacteroidales bacterium]|nr:hypothetical protein [Bacteroidales bacterium]
MIISKTGQKFISALQILMFFFFIFLIPVSAYSDNDETILRFKPEYKLKRVPTTGGVTIYSLNEEAQKEEYLFLDFNADVVYLIYRRINVDQITRNLAKKYYLSKADSRRKVKRVINTLDEWGMITE